MLLWKLFPWDKSTRENPTKDETINLIPTLKKVEHNPEKSETPKNQFYFNRNTTKSIGVSLKNKEDAYFNTCSITKSSKHKSNFAVTKMIKKDEILDDMSLDEPLTNEHKEIENDIKNGNSKLNAKDRKSVV